MVFIKRYQFSFQTSDKIFSFVWSFRFNFFLLRAKSSATICCNLNSLILEIETKKELNAPASSQLPFQPLAFFESCFPLKNGTPRQGILAPNAQGRLKIRPYRGTTPKDVLEGLDQYSHVWIVFWFHGNANKHLRAKVQPPRLNGVSVGCLATRTPHRLIPIGMTAAKLLRIENGDTLIVSGIDLIDGTPVLDIKPYVPRYDSIPDAICPYWMIQPTGLFFESTYPIIAH